MTNRERYYRLWGQLHGAKFATEDPKLSDAERAAALVEVNRLADEIGALSCDAADVADLPAQPSAVELEFGRGVKLPQDWREFQRGAQKAFEAEIDQMVKQKLTNK